METIIVIGAGAAGLMAAYELSKQNKKIIVLEASERLGGRIHTYIDNSFSVPVELGAEFIHGKLPHTFHLLKQANIKYRPLKGKMFYLENGEFKKQNNYSEHWNELMKRMKELKNDITLSDFLQEYFADDKYKTLRESVKRFAEGFDLADVSKVSTLWLYNEWSNEDDAHYRIDGGYQALVSYLESECKNNGCIIYNNCCIKHIQWQKNEVSIITMCSRYFKGNKVIITVPLSVLHADKNDLSYIEFTPAIDDYLNAAKNIGYGTVIKILLEFDEAFWQKEKKNVGFIFTEERVPTWWTQFPLENCILTGWLGGTKALKFKDADNEEILEDALKSLSSAFVIPLSFLKSKLKASKIVNWINVPQIVGGYSYSTINSIAAKTFLNKPVEQTIFFAGEALHDGISEGTVEAALISGKEAALKLLNADITA
ncbi:MAG: flavin monoamine oxidase family protein [Bacteroidia bacterium]